MKPCWLETAGLNAGVGTPAVVVGTPSPRADTGKVSRAGEGYIIGVGPPLVGVGVVGVVGVVGGPPVGAVGAVGFGGVGGVGGVGGPLVGVGALVGAVGAVGVGGGAGGTAAGQKHQCIKHVGFNIMPTHMCLLDSQSARLKHQSEYQIRGAQLDRDREACACTRTPVHVPLPGLRIAVT